MLPAVVQSFAVAVAVGTASVAMRNAVIMLLIKAYVIVRSDFIINITYN